MDNAAAGSSSTGPNGVIGEAGSLPAGGVSGLFSRFSAGSSELRGGTGLLKSLACAVESVRSRLLASTSSSLRLTWCC